MIHSIKYTYVPDVRVIECEVTVLDTTGVDITVVTSLAGISGGIVSSDEAGDIGAIDTF